MKTVDYFENLIKPLSWFYPFDDIYRTMISGAEGEASWVVVDINFFDGYYVIISPYNLKRRFASLEEAKEKVADIHLRNILSVFGKISGWLYEEKSFS